MALPEHTPPAKLLRWVVRALALGFAQPANDGVIGSDTAALCPGGAFGRFGSPAPGAFGGAALKTYYVDLAACCSLCLMNSKCVAFHVHASTNVCSLKESIEPVLESGLWGLFTNYAKIPEGRCRTATATATTPNAKGDTPATQATTDFACPPGDSMEPSTCSLVRLNPAGCSSIRLRLACFRTCKVCPTLPTPATAVDTTAAAATTVSQVPTATTTTDRVKSTVTTQRAIASQPPTPVLPLATWLSQFDEPIQGFFPDKVERTVGFALVADVKSVHGCAAVCGGWQTCHAFQWHAHKGVCALKAARAEPAGISADKPWHRAYRIYNKILPTSTRPRTTTHGTTSISTVSTDTIRVLDCSVRYNRPTSVLCHVTYTVDSRREGLASMGVSLRIEDANTLRTYAYMHALAKSDVQPVCLLVALFC